MLHANRFSVDSHSQNECIAVSYYDYPEQVPPLKWFGNHLRVNHLQCCTGRCSMSLDCHSALAQPSPLCLAHTHGNCAHLTHQARNPTRHEEIPTLDCCIVPQISQSQKNLKINIYLHHPWSSETSSLGVTLWSF